MHLHLTFSKLGMLLHLAERAAHARHFNADALALREAEDELESFLRQLSPDAFKDVAAIYGYGRFASDDFFGLREDYGHDPEVYPWVLKSRTDLGRSMIRGLARLDEESVFTCSGVSTGGST